MTYEENELVKQLQVIASIARSQRRLTMWILIMVPLLTVGFVAAIAYLAYLDNAQTTYSEPLVSWETVRTANSEGDLAEAIRMAEILVRKAPSSYSYHSWLAGLYVDYGKIKSAEIEYKKAYRLFPSGRNQWNVEAIEKRIAADAKAAKSKTVTTSGSDDDSENE